MTPSHAQSSPMVPSDLDFLCINTIRSLSIDAVDRANSGHPGLPLGAAPMAYVLWQYHLRHAPSHPKWSNRDRFVLSAGHGSMLLYSMLHLTGYDLSLDEIKNFRQWGSKTPGHPESFITRGVECTTGPLGQGAANAVGMAIAERSLAHRFNKPGFELVDHHTYALVSDGDLMEGVAAEAGSLAGHLKLGKLIYLYDANDITLDGPTSLAFSNEDVAKRYEAYGWQVLHVKDGNTDLKALDAAITAAKSDASRPTLIVIKTTIGYGSPNRQGSAESHGKPLGAEENRLTKQALGWKSAEPFFVPKEASEQLMKARTRGEALRNSWESLFEQYEGKFPELAKEWVVAQKGNVLPSGWDSSLPQYKAGEKLATRQASGKAIQAIAAKVPWLIGGDADLGSSTNTIIKEGGSFEGTGGSGRNIHYGVREHAMGSIANGMSYHGGIRPFVATFFVFSDYMRPAVRLAAMNNLPVVYVWTHDSILLGEDGPTHQPVEHLASLRAIPNLTVMRPADANETSEAWRYAMNHQDGPTALVLTRQNIATLEQTALNRPPVDRGAYVLSDVAAGEPDAIIIATGSEVSVAVQAQSLLSSEGIQARVVSMPSWEAFERQDSSYRDSVLPPAITARVAVEAASSFGWAKWVGLAGKVVGIDRFGASAPGEVLMKEYGITAEAVKDAVKSVTR